MAMQGEQFKSLFLHTNETSKQILYVRESVAVQRGGQQQPRDYPNIGRGTCFGTKVTRLMPSEGSTPVGAAFVLPPEMV